MELNAIYDFSSAINKYKERAASERMFQRSSVILQLMTPDGGFIPICAKRQKDLSGSPESSQGITDISLITARNWEWPGGKIDGGIEGEGLRRTFTDLDYLHAMREALREVGEELQVTNGQLHYIEPLPWNHSYLSNTVIDKQVNLYLKIAPFQVTVWSDLVPAIPATDEHFGGAWFKMLDWKDGNPREEYQMISSQLRKSVLFGRLTERPDVLEFVTTYREKDELLPKYTNGLALPSGYAALTLNDSSVVVARQYFAAQFFRNEFKDMV